ncbi:MAG: hypothetical protein HQL33_08790, partial [Alphaproteobacteria bacterium]|nr:hypothetical protein [Alphaproteobacteria bacterium]
MGKQVDFWREVRNSYGVTCHSVLKTVRVSGDVSEAEAVLRAARDFCAWGHVAYWNNLAHGYDLRCDPDDPRAAIIETFPEEKGRSGAGRVVPIRRRAS